MNGIEKSKMNMFDYKNTNNLYRNISDWTIKMNNKEDSKQQLFTQI